MHVKSPISALAAVLVLATTAHAQSGAIECIMPADTKNCEIQLAQDQDSVTVRFHLSVPIIGERRITYNLRDDQRGDTLVVSDLKQVGEYRWSGKRPQRDTIRILVQTTAAGVLQTDTIHLLAKTPAKARVRVPEYSRYVGLSGKWMPLTIRPEIVAEDSTRMHRDLCERVRYAFQPWASGEAKPDTGFGRWEAHGDGRVGRCIAETRWKLGETGPQQLQIHVGDDKTVERRSQTLQAMARQELRAVGGVAFFTRFNSRTDFYCETYEVERSACKDNRTASDTIKRSFSKGLEDGWKPFFGVEAPVYFSQQPGNPVAQVIFERTRLLVGTTFDEPDRNFMLGLAIAPIIQPAYERSPIQLHVGWRPVHGGFFAGGTVDGTGLINSVLNAFGAAI